MNKAQMRKWGQRLMAAGMPPQRQTSLMVHDLNDAGIDPRVTGQSPILEEHLEFLERRLLEGWRPS